MGLLLCSGLAADDKKADPIDAQKLVGKWEAKDKKADGGMVLEFTKDGKLISVATAFGIEAKVEGTYRADGTKLTLTWKPGDKDVRTISKLTGTELVARDGTGKETTLVRVKDK
jgi:uncharacterized protein (TIGR03066 family)